MRDGVLAHFDVKLSIRVLAPLAIAEVTCLVILNAAITIKGGAAGNEFIR